MDAIFILQQIAEKAIEFKKSIYMCFVDLQQTFDKVKLGDVLQILRARRVKSVIRQIIKELNTNNTIRITTGNITTKKILITSGIRQDDSLSPILFNLIIDEIIKEVKTVG